MKMQENIDRLGKMLDISTLNETTRKIALITLHLNKLFLL
jgi:hypothetical protein